MPTFRVWALGIVFVGFVMSAIAARANAQIQMNRGGGEGYSVSVTPDGTTERVEKNTDSVTVRFTVENTGTSADNYSLSCTASRWLTCVSVSPSSLSLDVEERDYVDVMFNVGSQDGTITLTATGSGDAEDDGYYTITVTGPALQTDLSPHNGDHEDLARCAEGCFAATYTHSTVPYFSEDAPRNVTLVYHGDRVDPRPFIYINVKHGGTTEDLPDTLHLKAEIDDVAVTFVNGETQLRIDAPTTLDWFRLGAQFVASSNGASSTGVYDLDIIVGADYGSDGIVWTEASTTLIVVNEATSPVARGWTIAGIQRLYSQSDGSMLATDGTGSAVYFAKDGSDFDAPAGEFSSLVAITGGHRRLYPDSSYVQFNSSGRMTYACDRYGNCTQVTYDGSNRVQYIYDPTYKPILLSYGSYGLSTIRGGTGLAYTYTYVTVASDTTLSVIKDPDSDSTRFQYDGSKRLSTIIDRGGNTTTLAYHSASSKTSNKLVSVTAPSITIYPDTNASPVTTLSAWQHVSVPYGSTSSTAMSLVKADSVYGSVTDPDGHTTSFTVNKWGQPTEVINALSDTTTITYSNTGLVVRTDHPTGGIDTTTYNSDGMLTWSRSADSVVVQVDYNSTWVTMPDSTWGSDRPTHQSWINGSNGWVDSTRTGISGNTRYYHASDGRVDSIVDALGERAVRYVYGGTNGNLDEIHTPGDRKRILGYDNHGRVTADSTVGQPKWHTGYDAMNRQVLVWVNDSVHKDSTTYTYDEMFLTKVTDPAGQEYEFGYNALGWTVWREDPADDRDSLFYDRGGNLVQWQNRRGHAISSTYDALGRRVKRWGSDTTHTPTDTITFHTSSTANWVKLHNRNATETAYLSPGGRVDSVASTVGGYTHTLRYLYTDGGQADSLWATSTSASFMGRRWVYDTTFTTLEEIRMGGKSVEMAYDDKLRPDSLVFEGGEVRRVGLVTWDATGEVEIDDEDLNDNLARKIDYDEVGRIHGQFTAPNPVERGHFLQYDGLGRILLDSLATVESDNCTWDEHDGWVCPPATTDSIHRYVWDEIGNLDSLIFHASAAAGTYGTGNRITAFGDCTYGTDDDGNVTWRKCTAVADTLFFTWSIDNRLVKIDQGDLDIEFFYDAAGRLVRRDEDGTSTYFLWNGNELFAELNSSGEDLVEYSYYGDLDNPHAVGIGDTVYFAHQDGFGNVIGLVAHSKHLRATYDYTLWGEGDGTLENLQGKTNRARFKGALWMGDAGPELYYMRARWYEARTGRFLGEDPLGPGGGVNPYVYAANNPTVNSDPSGLYCYAATVTITIDGVSHPIEGIRCQDIGVGDWDFIRRYLNEQGTGSGDVVYDLLSSLPHGGIGKASNCLGGFATAECRVIADKHYELVLSGDELCSMLGIRATRRFQGGRYVFQKAPMMKRKYFGIFGPKEEHWGWANWSLFGTGTTEISSDVIRRKALRGLLAHEEMHHVGFESILGMIRSERQAKAAGNRCGVS